MIYLVSKALQMSSAYTVLFYIRQKENINPARYLHTIDITKEERDAIKRTGTLAQLTSEKQEYVQKYIMRRLPDVFNSENITALFRKELRTYETAEVNDIVAEAKLNATEMSRLLCVRKSDYCKWKKNGFRRGMDELAYNIAKCVIKVKNHEIPEMNLMRLRWNRGYSLDTAANMLGISPEDLWKYEWTNCLPIDLIERVSKLYITEQENLPIEINCQQKQYGEMIRLIRRNNGIHLKEMSEKTGYSKSRCSYFETRVVAAPPYSYIEMLFNMAYGNTDDIESILLNEIKHDNKYIRVPAETVDYYRQIYFYVNSKPEDKKERSLAKFLTKCGVTKNEYLRERWTIKQAKKAVKILGLGKKYDLLTRKLTDTQKKIMDMKVDYRKLKAERLKQKKPIQLVALCTNRSCSTITKIENGRCKCSPEMFRLLSDYYEKNMEYFIEV